MKKKLTVLVSCAGRRNHLIRCFREDAQLLGVDLVVIACDVNPTLSAACLEADRAIAVPHARSDGFALKMNEICAEHGVDLVIPTIDTELAHWSNLKSDLDDRGVLVAVSSADVVALASNKIATCQHLAAAGIGTAKSCWFADYVANPDQLKWPVIIKPNAGSSSIGIAIPKDLLAVRSLAPSPDAIVQELWSGREYTVNMYVDRTGQMRCAIPHIRLEVRHGEVSKGRTEDCSILREAARSVAGQLPGAFGAICFQAIINDMGDYAIFEINARFGGGYPLAHKANARFSQWLLEEALGISCTANDNWTPGVTMLRYDAAIFVNA